MWSTRNASQLHGPQPDLAARHSSGPTLAGRSRLPLALGVAATVSLTPFMDGRAYAQDSSKRASAELQEIVVTAEFSQRTQLQRTPIAITAITARQLRDQGLMDLASIGENQLAPNVNLEPATAAFGPTLSVFIRGVGQGDFDPALEPGVAIYVDDVYFGETQGANLSLLDLARVEVLRGPQGTLFGKDAEGGAIRLVTKRPDGSNSGSVEATFGSLNRIDLRASYDMAISKAHDVYMRVSALSQRQDGYLKRLDYACVHPDLGAGQGYPVNTAAPQLLTSQSRQDGCVLGTEGGIDLVGGRIALRWAPSDLPIEMNLSGSIVQNDSEAAPTHLIEVLPAQLAGINGWLSAQYGVPFDQRFISPSLYTNYSTFLNISNGSSIPAQAKVDDDDSLTYTFDWNITPAMHLKAITGWRHFASSFSDDQDTTPLPVASATDGILHDQFSEEIRLTGTSRLGPMPLDYASGVFYLRNSNTLLNQIFLPQFDIFFDSNNPEVLNDKGVFGQLTLHPTRKLSVVGGLRYTWFRKRYTFDQVPVNQLNPAAPYALGTPVPIPYGFPLLGASAASKSSFIDWRAGINYQLTSNVMAYVTASTGHKGGGVNPRPFTAAEVVPFGTEKLTSEELGLKSEWFDHRLRINADVFTSQYKDLQLNANRTTATGVPFAGIYNVGRARISGLEAEVDVEPVSGLLIQGSTGYEHYKTVSLGTAVGCQDPSVANPVNGVNCVAGNPGYADKPVFTPDWNASLGVQYAINLGGRGVLTPRLDASYRAFEYGDVINSPASLANLPALTLLNARVTWSDPIPDWTVAFFVTNVTDKQYYINTFNLTAFGEGTIVGQPGMPREYGVTLERRF
jgi:iron complex outermembrane receptor protein